MFRQIRYFFFLLLALVSLSACKSTKIVDNSFQAIYQNCYEFIGEINSTSSADLYKPILNEDLKRHFSTQSIKIANAIHQTSDLENLIEKKDFDEFTQFKTYQKLINRITLIEMEIASFNSAIKCEEDILKQLVWQIEKQKSEKANNRAVSGIILGASANILIAGIVLNEGGATLFTDLFGIGVALTQIIINVSSRTVTYKAEIKHPVNLLAEFVRTKVENNHFPDHIWYYLNQQNGESSIRQSLIESWGNYNMSEQGEIYFSEEGSYTIEELQNRAAMLEQLVSSIDIMLHDLFVLRKELNEYLEMA